MGFPVPFQEIRNVSLSSGHLSLTCVEEFSIETRLHVDRISLDERENFKEFWKVHVSEI